LENIEFVTSELEAGSYEELRCEEDDKAVISETIISKRGANTSF